MKQIRLRWDLFKNSDKYAILASCSPKNGNINNIRRLFDENTNKFVGLKFHPSIQNLSPQDKKYEPYMEFAAKNNLPCLFHCQVETLPNGKINSQKISVSDPELIYELAKKYKDTPVVLAHLGAGWNEAHDKTIDVLIQSIKNNDANLYADISWVDIDHPQTHTVKAVKRLKGIGEKDWKYGDRSYMLMFGTDAPLGRFKADSKEAREIYFRFAENIKTAIRNDNDLKPDAEKIIEDLFYNNAKKIILRMCGKIKIFLAHSGVRLQTRTRAVPLLSLFLHT